MRIIIIIVVLLVSVSGKLLAAPFTPESPAYVVTESIKKVESKYFGTIKQLKGQVKSGVNFTAAVNLADTYIKLARETDEPRYYGLAETLVKPWWDVRNNTQFNLLKAILLQFNHKFEESNQILTYVISQNPRNASALLLRANNLMANGAYKSALEDCYALTLISSPSVSAACVVAIKGLQLDSSQINVLLNNVFLMMQREKGLNKASQQWIASILFELSLLHKQYQLLDAAYEYAHNAHIIDEKLRVLYSYSLIQRGMRENINSVLTEKEKGIEARILHLLALKNSKQLQFQQERKEVEARLRRESRRSGLHLRQLAMFELYINNNPRKAFLHAKKNWKIQQSISDAMLLFQCAAPLGEIKALDELKSWQYKNDIKVDFSQFVV